MFSESLDELGTYWLNKLPNVSYQETLKSCIDHRSYGTQPGHARFYYPKKYGYGEVFERIANSMTENIVVNSSVEEMDVRKRSVVCSDGQEYQADIVISTIPWISFNVQGITDELLNSIKQLKHSSTEIRYVDENIDSQAHWIYIPDENVPYHRILCRKNFCSGSKGYWVETHSERIKMYDGTKWENNYKYLNEFAYPLNTVEKPRIMRDLLTEVKTYGVIGLGRWGEHEHYNSDVVIEKAMDLANALCV